MERRPKRAPVRRPTRLRAPRKRLMFVTGGTGFLGHHIVNGPATDAWEIVAPSSTSLDLRNRESVISTIRDWKPTAIVHTAYRRGDRSSIVDATRNVAAAAAAAHARLVFVSTDAVFAGRPAPYTEADLPDPIHDYGCDKADAEEIVFDTCPTGVVVRTSLLLGRSQLSAHERVVGDAIRDRSRMTFFTDEVRCPLLVDDLAGALAELAGRPGVSGIVHVAGPLAMSRAELAVMIAQRHGWDATRLRIGPMGEARFQRPDHVVLDCSLARSLGISVRGPGDW